MFHPSWFLSTSSTSRYTLSWTSRTIEDTTWDKWSWVALIGRGVEVRATDKGVILHLFSSSVHSRSYPHPLLHTYTLQGHVHLFLFIRFITFPQGKSRRKVTWWRNTQKKKIAHKLRGSITYTSIYLLKTGQVQDELSSLPVNFILFTFSWIHFQ